MRSADEQEILAKLQEDATATQAASTEVTNADATKLPDMPESVLDGKLGEICSTRLKEFPTAYGWPSLITTAGALVRPNISTVRANLNTCLVGPVHSGKSTAIERAIKLMDIREPLLAPLKAGSAEGLLAKLGDRKGDSVLLFPDELAHVLEKAQITGASFPYILNSLFYRDADTLTIAHGKQVSFNCRLSIIGGLVDDKFEDSFASATTGGLYDRFLFGQCPSNFEFLWRPFEGSPAFEGELEEVHVNCDVWEARDHLAKHEQINPRILEIALRCAAICAAFDQRKVLRAADLSPAWELARYQSRVRILLQPNAGKNFEAQVALRILNYLTRHAPQGKWLVLREVLHSTRAYCYGPSVAQRSLNAMAFGGSIEMSEQKMPSGQHRQLVKLSGAIRP